MTGTAKHYDVVVAGCGLGALAAAALLARRSWRVLILGNGYTRSAYTWDGLPLARRMFTFTAATSPAWSRIVVELAQSQVFRRRLTPLDPMFQIVDPSRQWNACAQPEAFAREVEREFPMSRRAVDELGVEITAANAGFDRAFATDIVFPPGGFWERREAAGAFANAPYVHDAPHAPGRLSAPFEPDHSYHNALSTVASFASDIGGPIDGISSARLVGSWSRGLLQLEGGEDELVDFLLERLKAHGGEARLGDRLEKFVHRGACVRAVHVAGEPDEVGLGFLLSDLPSRDLMDLAVGRVARGHELSSGAEVTEQRYVVSLAVHAKGVPEPLAAESFLLPAHGLTVHVQKHQPSTSQQGVVLLVAEAILSVNEATHDARERVLATLFEFLPFLERHILLCDSPYDGRPLWDMRETTSGDPQIGPPSWGLRARPIDRVHLRAAGCSVEAEPMIPRYRGAPSQAYGFGGEPLRTRLRNAFVVGKSVLPALGQEGELLAAWSAARIVTKTDRQKERMRREMWSKVELS